MVHNHKHYRMGDINIFNRMGNDKRRKLRGIKKMSLYGQKLTVEERITRAKIQMYQRSPFFSYILLHLKPQESDKVPSMGVNPKGDLLWNRKWIETLDDEEIIGVLAHETMHMALQHLDRGKGKNREVFNVATDLVVNGMLKRNNFKLPTSGVIPDYNDSFEIFNQTIKKISEKSAEQVYDEIYPLFPKIKTIMTILSGSEKGNKKSGGGKNKDKNSSSGMSQAEIKEGIEKLKGFDKHVYGENGETEKEAHKRKQDWKKIVAEATQLAKQQGKLPAGIERHIEELLDSKVDWRTQLYKYVVAQIIHDYSWRMPGKRTASLGVYMPTTLRESVHIVVSIDTSGSISNADLKNFLSELLSIGTSFPNIKMDIIICDAEVHETYELTKDNVEDIVNLKMSGGGGTSHIPIYDHVVDNIHDAKVLINFTDGYTSFPKNPEELPFDSLWVLDKHGIPNNNIPFGEVIRLE